MEEQEIHIRDYLRILNKRRLTVIAFFIIVFTVVVLRTLSAIPIYRATTRALIQKNEPQNLSLVNSYYVPWDPEFYETQVQIIKSTGIAEKVVAMLDLTGKYEELTATDKKPLLSFFRKGDDQPAEGEEEKEELTAEGLARVVSAGLIVTPVKDSKIVTISYLSSNPELATMIVNSVAKAYAEELLEMRMSASRYAISWMTEKAGEEKVKLENAERRLQAYMKASDIITLENRIAIIPQKLSELSMQLTKAETRRKELESIYRKVAVVGEDPGAAETAPIIQSDQTVQALRGQILKAEQVISELSKKYGEKHPTMIAARSDLQILRRKKDEALRRAILSVSNEYELARSGEEDLQRRLSKTKEEALELNEKFIQYEVLKREVETNRQFFEALMTKTKEQSITEQIQSINVWILEEAEVPLFPERPRKSRNILLGIVVGLFGGVGMAFFIEYLDNTVKNPEELESKIGLPVIGLIPRLKEKGKKIEEVVLKEPRSVYGESYKALRTSILLSSAESPPKSILVTSMISGEGKTSTALNLAVATAQSNHSTLLIDGDLRKPRVHRFFGLKNLKGLSTYLAGVSDGDIVEETKVKNLSVISPGPVPPNPSELLGSRRLGELLEKQKEKFDIIIFDSPPLLTVADSLLLARLLDVTVVVTRAGTTTYEMVRRGLKSLHDINASILGLVINGFEESRSGYYYNYHDKYSTYYEFPGQENNRST